MLQGKRNQKIAQEIKNAIAEGLIHKSRDPRIGFATVTEVQLSEDLKHAIIYISVLGEEKDKKGSLIALNHAKGHFQKIVASQLKLRYTPKIQFRLDNTAEEAMKIDKILQQIHEEEGYDTGSEDTTED